MALRKKERLCTSKTSHMVNLPAHAVELGLDYAMLLMCIRSEVHTEVEPMKLRNIT